MRRRQRATSHCARARSRFACALLGSTILLASPAAWAGVDIIGPVVIEGATYTGDSSEGITEFEDAIAGRTLTLIPFTRTSTGELIVLDAPYERTARSDTFSEDVLFRSPAFTPETSGLEGADPDQVNLTGQLYETGSGEVLRYPDDYVINPLPGTSDPLEIDFVNANESVMAVGLGVYANLSQTLTVYNSEDEVVASYDHLGDEGYVFVGFVATTPEDAVGRIEINGSETFVLDVAFVPEPATGFASAVALFTVFGLARRRRP